MFRRGYTSDLSDQYETGLLMLTCSDDEGLHLIEIPYPDGVHYRGIPLSGAVTTVLNDLRTAGIEITADDSNWLLADGAIALYTPSSEPDAQVKAVTAFGPGREMHGEIISVPAGPDATPPASSYLVTPGTGVGSIMLGQHRDGVRRRLNGVLLDGINLMPAYPLTIEDVRPLLVQAGHRLIELEAGNEIADAGVQVLTMRPSPSSDGPMPVACVAISARTASPGGQP